MTTGSDASVIRAELRDGDRVGPIRGRDARDHGCGALHAAYSQKPGIEAAGRPLGG